MTEEAKGINSVICLNLCQVEAKKDGIETMSFFPPHIPPGTGSFHLCLLQHLNKTC